MSFPGYTACQGYKVKGNKILDDMLGG